MPSATTYPGVYIEELPSGVRTIVGTATSIAAFAGRALRGPVETPTDVFSFADYERTFGGLSLESTMSYAVRQFFMNGGGHAIIVRLNDGATKATIVLSTADAEADLTLEAANPGSWGDNLKVTIDHTTATAATDLFNLTVKEYSGTKVVQSEVHYNLSVDTNSARYVGLVLSESSRLLRLNEHSDDRPVEVTDAAPVEGVTQGSDGSAIEDEALSGATAGSSFYTLDKADTFNLLCLPPPNRDEDWSVDDWAAALAYCTKRGAMLLVDAPASWTTVAAVTDETGLAAYNSLRDKNSAMFFPRIKMADPLKEGRLQSFAPCGAVAGVIARTDASRGLWKAPAGQDARLMGVQGLSVGMTDAENGLLNPQGLNCLRSLPVAGPVIWGSRTLEGADRLASDWKYLPVRRLALHIEASLYRGTQWVVFEPNDEPLWAQIRLSVGSFMHDLFRQGAFKGISPREAYLVKCDADTTTQDDINQGRVNILVGFAPLKPAEFVVIQLQQLAGQGAA